MPGLSLYNKNDIFKQIKEGAAMSGNKKNLIITAGVLLVLILLAGGTAAYTRNYYMKSIYKPLEQGNNIKNVTVTIKPGSSMLEIADVLYGEGLIRNKLMFRIYLKRSKIGSRLQAGKYALNSGMTADEIAKKIAKGDVVKDTVKVTIPEGQNLRQIAEKLDEAGLVDKDDFIKAAESSEFDYEFLKNLSDRPVKLEGYLFPDTYEFKKGITSEQIIKKMLNRFNEVFDDDMKNKAKDMGFTVDQVVTIASMIENEAKAASERPVIASVIYNRLKAKMKLQIDATVLYAMGQWKSKVTNEDLDVDSPYNTYKYAGLPAGPISNPGKASLEAAVNPVASKYYYYVLKKGTDTHVFSRTYAEHKKAIAANRAN